MSSRDAGRAERVRCWLREQIGRRADRAGTGTDGLSPDHEEESWFVVMTLLTGIAAMIFGGIWLLTGQSNVVLPGLFSAGCSVSLYGFDRWRNNARRRR